MLNNILEEAKQKNKELWIAFQDMAKAYDSISIEGLKRALNRIDVPETIINFLTNLFKNRESHKVSHQTYI